MVSPSNAYLETVDRCLQPPSTTTTDMENGIIFGEATPPAAAVEALTDRLTDRIKVAIKVQTRIRQTPVTTAMAKQTGQDMRQFRFNLMQLSVFVFADLETLQIIAQRDKPERLFFSIRAAESFLGIFLNKRHLKAPALDEAGEPIIYSPVSEGTPDKVDRSEKERQKALNRDGGRCVFCHTIHPEVAHIWPFSSTATWANYQDTRECLARNCLLMSRDLQNLMQDLIADRGLGLSDTDWNLVAMCANSHIYWSHAYFGLKWHEKLGDVVELVQKKPVKFTLFTVQWHWLPLRISDSIAQQLLPPPQRPLDPRRLVRLDTDDDSKAIADAFTGPLTSYPSLFTPKEASLRDDQGRLIKTGRLFTLRVESDNLDKMKAMIDAQWLATRMASLSGAAEVADELNPQPPPADWGAMFENDDLPTLDEQYYQEQ